MAERKVTAPAGMAGIVRYAEEERSIAKIKPEIFLALCTVLLLLEIALHYV